jgi:glycosyltransferase involved in cell wall biosynthesis
MIKYSVIICSYNRFELLVETIDSVLSVIKNRTDVEILIIDNNSPDSTSSLNEKYSSSKTVKYFLENKQGLSHARNRGMKEASGDILVYLDDDVELVNNYFEIADSVLSDESISILGGKVLPFNTELPTWLPKKYYFLVSIFDEGEYRKNVKYLMGANFMVRKMVANKIGGFNTRLGRNGSNLAGGEEIDFLNRAHSLQYVVYYTPDLIVYHKINDKLNENYVLTYSKELGKSERIIDESNSQLRVINKIFKSHIAIFIHILLSNLIKEEKKNNYLRIINQYAKGYINKKEN